MEKLDFNVILNREHIVKQIKDILNHFEENKQHNDIKRGIYIYGNPGVGKTTFVKKTLESMNYDIIHYDAGNIRNKNVIQNITKDNMSDTNVLSLFQKTRRKLAIVMDEIDGMNNGDKGGINALIKLIRPKKTKKQKSENSTMIPVICIGSYKKDKKIKEIMKICHSIELTMPKDEELMNIIDLTMNISTDIKTPMIKYIQSDIRKLMSCYNIYLNNKSLLKNELMRNIFQTKNYNEDTKEITRKLLLNKYSMDDHFLLINETDRTSVGLLYHENIIEMLKGRDKATGIKFYYDMLDNFCFSDYIDRITFQKQIWIFNEMSSLIKTFYNNNLFHDKYNNEKDNNEKDNKKTKLTAPSEIRFTKVLTKYSTEFNNTLFIHNLCKIFNMDKKDVISYFNNLRKEYDIEDVYNIFTNNNEISKLDIQRFFRYLDYSQIQKNK